MGSIYRKTAVTFGRQSASAATFGWFATGVVTLVVESIEDKSGNFWAGSDLCGYVWNGIHLEKAAVRM